MVDSFSAWVRGAGNKRFLRKTPWNLDRRKIVVVYGTCIIPVIWCFYRLSITECFTICEYLFYQIRILYIFFLARKNYIYILEFNRDKIDKLVNHGPAKARFLHFYECNIISLGTSVTWRIFDQSVTANLFSAFPQQRSVPAVLLSDSTQGRRAYYCVIK